VTFNEDDRQRARAIIDAYPVARSAVMPLLHLAQDRDGWVTPEAMREIAEMLALTPAEVLGVCAFYTMYKREPVGNLVVSVCTNVTCLVRGGPELYDRLQHHYADDGDVFVEEVECLAACDGAPCLQVNYEYHLDMTPETAVEIVDAYRSGQRRARGVSGGASAPVASGGGA